MEWNKIIAAFILALLLYKGLDILAESAFEIPEMETTAYVVEGLVVDEPEAAEATPEPEAAPATDLMALLAVASPEQGKRAFRRCQSCHDANQGTGHKIGPNLFAVMGAAVAQHGDYKYSSAMAGHGGTWDFALMDDWLASPAAAIPGNKMTFAGMPKAGDRAALIVYLNSKSDNPLALPVPAPVAPEPEAAEDVTEAADEDAVTEAVEGVMDEAGDEAAEEEPATEPDAELPADDS
jgi:cytochrome c